LYDVYLAARHASAAVPHASYAQLSASVAAWAAKKTAMRRLKSKEECDLR